MKITLIATFVLALIVSALPTQAASAPAHDKEVKVAKDEKASRSDGGHGHGHDHGHGHGDNGNGHGGHSDKAK